jgi:pimeloyl-ACP methyl ester carboxylesterase
MDPTTARLAALLAPRFTVTHYDRRGRGDSGDTEPYAVEREVEDLEALVEEAGGSALLYGMSSGGALALEAGARGVAAYGITTVVLNGSTKNGPNTVARSVPGPRLRLAVWWQVPLSTIW